jgi:hypothetical protein
MNKRKISGIAALVAILTTSLVAQPAAEADTRVPSEALGMYVGFNEAGRFAAYEKALGGPFRWSVIMAVGKSPSDMKNASWGQLVSDQAYLPDVSDRVNLVITVPLAFGPGGLARTESGQLVVGEKLRETAAGKWDNDYRVIAKHLKDAGYGDAVIRLGHEFDTDWPSYSARNNNDAYIAAFRHVHDVFERESSGFTFDWTSTRAHFRKYGPPAYPGDSYVDIVGLDIYYRTDVFEDRIWDNQYLPVLQAHRDFAKAHGKPVSYPEWGRAMGADSVFIDRMHGWFSDLPATGPGRLLYQAYFNEHDKTYDLDRLPIVKQRYLELFKSSGSAPAPSPAVLTPTSPSASPTTQPVTSGGLVVELPAPPETVTPSRGTAAQVTDTLPPPVEQQAPTPTSPPIVTTPPNPGITIPVGAVTASVKGTATLPSISVVRDATSLAITYRLDDAKLFNIRHRPAGSKWWKWEVQTKATSFSVARTAADTAHVVQVSAYVNGKWRDWNTVTVDPVAAATGSKLENSTVTVSNDDTYLPKIWSTRAGTTLTLNYRHPDAKLYVVRHRPAGSSFWKWEDQTRATSAHLTGLDASKDHVVQVKAYIDGRWRDWQSLDVDA